MAQGLLPAEVTKVGVTTAKRQNSMLLVFSIYDKEDKYKMEFIENYAKINLIPEIQRVKGVGEANVFGQDYSMRAQKIIKEAQVLFFTPPMIPGYSASSDIELNMQDKTGGDINKFNDVVKGYIAALSSRPEIKSAQTTFNPKFPEYMIDIDAAACSLSVLPLPAPIRINPAQLHSIL